MKVTIEYSTNSNEDRDRIANVLHSHLCGRQAYIDSLIGLNIDKDRTIIIWVDHHSELATGHYVSYICELLHRARYLLEGGDNEEDTPKS